MKKLIVIFMVSCSGSFCFSQEVSMAPVTNITDGPGNSLEEYLSIHFAQTYSRFRYRDSEGNKDTELSYDFKSSYGFNYTKFFTPEIFIRPELGYKNLGAVSILNNQKMDWSMHYLDLNGGGGYLKKIGNFPLIPYGGLSLYISYLYKASQTLGVNYYDMLANKGIKRMDFGVNLFAGGKYAFSGTNAVFIEIRNSTGLHQLEKNSEEGQSQKLFNRAVSFHFGVSFNIIKN